MSAGVRIPPDPTLSSEFSFHTSLPPQADRLAEHNSRLHTPRFSNARRNLQARSLQFVRTGSGAHAQQMSVVDSHTQSCVPVVVGSASSSANDLIRIHALVSGDEKTFSDTSVDSSRATSPERSPVSAESTRKRTRSRSISNSPDTHSSTASSASQVTASSNLAHMDIFKPGEVSGSNGCTMIQATGRELTTAPVVVARMSPTAPRLVHSSKLELQPLPVQAAQSSCRPPAECKRRRMTPCTSTATATNSADNITSHSADISASLYQQDSSGVLINSLIAASRSLSTKSVHASIPANSQSAVTGSETTCGFESTDLPPLIGVAPPNQSGDLDESADVSSRASKAQFSIGLGLAGTSHRHIFL